MSDISAGNPAISMRSAYLKLRDRAWIVPIAGARLARCSYHTSRTIPSVGGFDGASNRVHVAGDVTETVLTEIAQCSRQRRSGSRADSRCRGRCNAAVSIGVSGDCRQVSQSRVRRMSRDNSIHILDDWRPVLCGRYIRILYSLCSEYA